MLPAFEWNRTKIAVSSLWWIWSLLEFDTDRALQTEFMQTCRHHKWQLINFRVIYANLYKLIALPRESHADTSAKHRPTVRRQHFLNRQLIRRCSIGGNCVWHFPKLKSRRVLRVAFAFPFGTDARKNGPVAIFPVFPAKWRQTEPARQKSSPFANFTERGSNIARPPVWDFRHLRRIVGASCPEWFANDSLRYEKPAPKARSVGEVSRTREKNWDHLIRIRLMGEKRAL